MARKSPINLFKRSAHPCPEPGEALIRLRLAGICSTDLEMLKGYYDFTGVGSRCGPFEPALRLLRSQLVDPVPLIDQRFPLRLGKQAFQHASLPGAMKILLYPERG